MAAIAIVGSLAYVNAAWAQTKPGDLPAIFMDPFVDRQSTETKVGGRPLVGAIAYGDVARGLTAPVIQFPSEVLKSQAPVCLETVSIDGAYWAQGRIASNQLLSGQTATRIAYGRKDHPEDERKISGILAAFDESSVALLATVGNCQDQTAASPVVVVGRDAGDLTNQSGVRLYVNSARNQVEVSYSDAAGVTHLAACRPSGEARQRIAFDTLCDLPGPLGASTSVAITMLRFERRMPARNYTLLVGGRDLAARK